MADSTDPIRDQASITVRTIARQAEALRAATDPAETDRDVRIKAAVYDLLGAVTTLCRVTRAAVNRIEELESAGQSAGERSTRH